MAIGKHDNKRVILLLLFLLLLPMLSACSLRSVDDALGRGFERAKNGDFVGLFDSLITGEKIEIIEDLPDIDNFDFKTLTKSQKVYIDAWLRENKYNRYGDPDGTSYASGTPLINPENGESIERYKYIINQIPDLIKRIKGIEEAESDELNREEAKDSESINEFQGSVGGSGEQETQTGDMETIDEEQQEEELPPNNF